MTEDEKNELAFRLGRIAGRLTVIKDDVLSKLKWNEHGFFEYRAEIGILLDDCLKDTDILTPIFPKDAVKAELADEIEAALRAVMNPAAVPAIDADDIPEMNLDADDE